MEKKQKKTRSVLLLLLSVALIAAVVAGVLFLRSRQGLPVGPAQQGAEVSEAEEVIPSVALQMEHIQLTFPADLMERITVEYETLTDGQQAVFYTELAEEKLELFRFSLSLSGTDGYRLGILRDKTAGDLIVCVEVQGYSEGSWKPEDYTALNALQERVNDIIAQFYEDSRFVPDR